MPLPVGGGPRFFFGTTLVLAINHGTIETSRGEAVSRLPDHFENEADIQNIVLVTDLLLVMLAQPDADTAIDGMHRVMQIISEHAHALRERMYGVSNEAPARRTHRKRDRQRLMTHHRRLKS